MDGSQSLFLSCEDLATDELRGGLADIGEIGHNNIRLSSDTQRRRLAVFRTEHKWFSVRRGREHSHNNTEQTGERIRP